MDRGLSPPSRPPAHAGRGLRPYQVRSGALKIGTHAERWRRAPFWGCCPIFGEYENRSGGGSRPGCVCLPAAPR
ncbi:hypothetical protein NDU88_002055 [Pleurodeles waltl]|uniref:Uncharacterized protein n=1 Tax=Pleurodeles waltl TaxID=8319 RepID=A0AAV7S9B6_PLEWA|nr:hypothetical protein NDU88_002055 [Pleurodeles waltl]